MRYGVGTLWDDAIAAAATDDGDDDGDVEEIVVFLGDACIYFGGN